MAEDAFDQPDIDTLFMALPISDPEQSIGRILRLHNGKQTPVVMDLCDENVSFCSHLKNSRLKFYIRKGWSTKAIKS
jgi:superfamily II DNA or RNA helicase